MEEKRRYKHTKVRDKQPIIRSLNTFSKQYKYIYAEEIEVDLDREPINLYYKDEEDKDLHKIYSSVDSEIDLQNYHLICEAVDSLFGIGATEWKEDLKKEIYQYGSDNMNYFLSDKFEESAKHIISQFSPNPKIYNYIKNYVKYSHSGIYQLNKSKRLKVKPIDTFESFDKRLAYLEVAKELYRNTIKEIQDTYNQIEKTLEEWRKNPNFDSSIIDKNNDSLLHPIDDSEQSDTLAMIEREKTGIYDENTLKEYQDWKKNISDRKKVLEKKLKPLEYAFDFHFNFEPMENFSHFRIEEFKDSKIFEAADEFQEELQQLIDNSEKYANARREFLNQVKQHEDEYTYKNWIKERLSEWEGLLFRSLYTHKLNEVTNTIKEGLSSDDVKNSFRQFHDLGMRLLNFEQDKIDDIRDMIQELDTILEQEEQEEINYEYLAENYEEIIAEKEDYQISDMDWLIENGYIEDETDWRDIQWYIEKKESERNAEHNRIKF